jgi:hypothetical protein
MSSSCFGLYWPFSIIHVLRLRYAVIRPSRGACALGRLRGPAGFASSPDHRVLMMLQLVALVCATRTYAAHSSSVRHRTDRNLQSLLNDPRFSVQVEWALLSGQGCRLLENGSSNRVR